MEGRHDGGPRVVFSGRGGRYLPCQVVGGNAGYFLVLTRGEVIPTPRKRVYELQAGWRINHRGRVSAIEDFIAGEEPPAVLAYQLETAFLV